MEPYSMGDKIQLKQTRSMLLVGQQQQLSPPGSPRGWDRRRARLGFMPRCVNALSLAEAVWCQFATFTLCGYSWPRED